MSWKDTKRAKRRKRNSKLKFIGIILAISVAFFAVSNSLSEGDINPIETIKDKLSFISSLEKIHIVTDSEVFEEEEEEELYDS